MLDKLLALAESAGIEAIIVLTKKIYLTML